MSVGPQRRLYVLMAQALFHQQDRRPKVDEQGSVGVPQVVEPDGVHAGLRAPLEHRPPEVMLRERKEPVIRLGVVKGVFVGPYLIAQLFRQRYHPAAPLGLWVRYDLFALHALEVPADGEGPGLQVYVLRAEGQQLPYPQAGPEQDRQAGPGGQLFNVGNELVELLHRPERHLLRVFLAHAPGEPGRIDTQAVVFAGVVEYGRKLVVDGLRVGRGHLVREKLRLPLADVGRGDLVEREVPKEREDPVLDNVSLVLHGGPLEARLHVPQVDFHERAKGHITAPGAGPQELFFKRLGVLLALEAPLLFEASLALPVGVVK